jgi:hypothetical protein
LKQTLDCWVGKTKQLHHISQFAILETLNHQQKDICKWINNNNQEGHSALSAFLVLLSQLLQV